MTADFRVTLLGTSSPSPGMERFGMSTLIEAGDARLLVDCGRGAIQRLFQLGVDYTHLDRLFLTHLHSDHLVGIPDLWLTGWVMGRKTPFRVWGPAGSGDMMAHLEQAFKADIHIRRDLDERLPQTGIDVAAQDIAEGFAHSEGGVTIRAFDVDHYPVTPAFGYRVEYAGKVVVLSGDTRPCDNLVKHARGADLLIQEIIAPQAFLAMQRRMTDHHRRQVIAHHTTPEQAGEIFSRINPGLAVYSHVIPPAGADEEILEGTRAAYGGRVAVGRDMMRIEIGDEVRIADALA